MPVRRVQAESEEDGRAEGTEPRLQEQLDGLFTVWGLWENETPSQTQDITMWLLYILQREEPLRPCRNDHTMLLLITLGAHDAVMHAISLTDSGVADISRPKSCSANFHPSSSRLFALGLLALKALRCRLHFVHFVVITLTLLKASSGLQLFGFWDNDESADCRLV